MFDTDLIPKEHRQRFVIAIKSASWFMKHADRGRTGAAKEFDFDPDWNLHLIMFAIFGIQYLGEDLTVEEVAFERWQALNNPELMTDEGKRRFEEQFSVDSANAMRRIPKLKFFEGFRDLMSKA